MLGQRIDPHVVVRRLSPFRSSRNGTRIEIITIHATESPEVAGAADLAAIGDWFCNPIAKVSSHVCTDANAGYSARYVVDEEKAWHCAGYNSVSLGIEQIGHTAQTEWKRDELRETARWVARWSLMHGVPIRHGSVNGGQVVRSGVVRHSDLGVIGGGHGDPGAPYPMDDMLALAGFYRGKLLARHS
jgi:hypothetical protein